MTTTPQDDKNKHLLKATPRSSFWQRIRNNFLTGIVVVAPFGITIYLTWTIIDYVDQQVLPQVLPLIPEPYQPQNLLPFSLPGLGLVVFILFLIFVGSFTKNFFGRELLKIGERWVERMPVVRSLYNALKQIAETIFTQSSKSFENACLVEYPRKGIWAIAFISTPTKGEVKQKAMDGGEMLSVFLPTTPNPTSGFLLFVPKEDVVILDMSIEDAAKLVISAGLVAPPTSEEKLIQAAHDAHEAEEKEARGSGPGRRFTDRLLSRRRAPAPAEGAEELAGAESEGDSSSRNPVGGV